jgi:outer membrane protein TolC
MGGAQPDTSASARSSVRQLDESLQANEAQLRIANRQWIPTVSVSSAFSRVGFSTGIPAWGNFLNNLTVSVGASLPIYTGGALRGASMVAQAAVDEARARLDQTRELAALDARQSIFQLQQAEAALAASSGTQEQATRAYRIAEVRFREGISTQLELSESRLLLEQAAVNRVQAARNVQVARMRLALLKDLPLGAGSGSFGGAGAQPAGGFGGAPGGGAVGGAQAPGQGGAGQRGTPAAAATTGTGQPQQ